MIAAFTTYSQINTFITHVSEFVYDQSVFYHTFRPHFATRVFHKTSQTDVSMHLDPIRRVDKTEFNIIHLIICQKKLHTSQSSLRASQSMSFDECQGVHYTHTHAHARTHTHTHTYNFSFTQPRRWRPKSLSLKRYTVKMKKMSSSETAVNYMPDDMRACSLAYPACKIHAPYFLL
jgi:hypothetical protein